LCVKHRVIHEKSVTEDDGRAIAPGVLIENSLSVQFNVRHGPECKADSRPAVKVSDLLGQRWLTQGLT
jgi:hypothetical protein